MKPYYGLELSVERSGLCGIGLFRLSKLGSLLAIDRRRVPELRMGSGWAEARQAVGSPAAAAIQS